MEFKRIEFKWVDNNNGIIACIEKNKIMNENMEEILQLIQNALEDATLMGVSKQCFLENISTLVENFLNNH